MLKNWTYRSALFVAYTALVAGSAWAAQTDDEEFAKAARIRRDGCQRQISETGRGEGRRSNNNENIRSKGRQQRQQTSDNVSSGRRQGQSKRCGPSKGKGQSSRSEDGLGQPQGAGRSGKTGRGGCRRRVRSNSQGNLF